MIRSLLIALLASTLAACSSLAPDPGQGAKAPRTVVLVSLDGFRPADLAHAPHLASMARDGVRAGHMRPSYPTLTFPNHHTLVTGLRPDRHGIVHNTMRDAALGAFSVSDNEGVPDARWWSDAEPLWVTVEKAGLRSASYFWPGTSAAVGGLRPWRWHAYDETVPAARRVDATVEWLTLPAAERPRLVLLYLEHVDEATHDHGPGSAEALAAVHVVDTEVGRLRAALAARGLADHVDLVVVSDHGSAEVPPDHRIALEDMAPPEIAEAVSDGQSIGFRPRPGREAEARARLVGRHAHYACATRETLPAHWRYGRHPRVPPIVCQMDEGWDAYTRARIAAYPRTHMRGSHGYDPALPSMGALFVADGPSFRDGLVLPPFDNVDVYPLLTRLLGVAPQPNDGDPATLAPALRDAR